MADADKNRVWNTVESILGLIGLLSLSIFIHLNMIHELHDPDVWMHFKTGEYIIRHGSVPKVDIFSSTMSGKEWIEHTWLVRVIYYLVFHYGGSDSLLFLSSILVVLALLILFFSVYTQRQYLSLLVGIFFLTVSASATRFNIRPENFSFLFFSLYLFILIKQIRKKWLFLLPLIQLIWVNCHIYFILGPFLLGTFLLFEKLKRTNFLPWSWSKTDLLDEQSYRNLVKVFFLVCLVSFINPYGYRGVLNPFWINLNAIGKSNIYYKHIQEFMPVWWFNYRIIFAYYGLIIVSLLEFLINFRRINISYFIIWFVFLILSIRINRFMIFFNFIAFLAIVDNLNKGAYLKKLYANGFIPEKTKYFLRCTAIILVIVWTTLVSHDILMSSYYIYEENRLKSLLLGITAKTYPVKAADFIVEHKLPGNLFNLFNCGSYLVYRLYPERKVFIDGRTELYGGDFFKDYLKILSLNRNTINVLFKKYNINTVLLSENSVETSKLARYFFDEPDWALVYFDEDSLIFLKNAPENKILIDKFKIDLKNWQTPKADINRIGLRRIFPDTYIRRAWMFYYLGCDAQAMNETREALRILPSNADSYNIIGRFYLKRKLYDQAFENLRLAHIYAPSNVETLISFGSLYMHTGITDAAINTCERLTKLNPRFPDGYYLLSHAYSKANKIALAIKSLKKAINLNPFNPRYYKELAGLFYKEKRPAEAIKIYRQAVSLDLDTQNFYEHIKK
jgi:tetratricopeptide (TPR) repeat protein